MSLRVTPVSQSLDRKLKILGYEVPDLLAIFFTLSVLNFIFGQSGLKVLLVWFPSLALAVTLRVAKRGKPDHFLVHFVQYQFSKKQLSAFQPPTVDTPPQTLRRNVPEKANSNPKLNAQLKSVISKGELS